MRTWTEQGNATYRRLMWRWMTVQDAARVIGCTQSLIHQASARGQIRAIRVPCEAIEMPRTCRTYRLLVNRRHVATFAVQYKAWKGIL